MRYWIKAICFLTDIDFSAYCSTPTNWPASWAILCRSPAATTCVLTKLFLRWGPISSLLSSDSVYYRYCRIYCCCN